MEPRVFVRALVIVTLLAGCGSPPPAAAKKTSTTADDPAAELATVVAALRKPGVDANYYRLTLDHLNTVLAKLPDRQVKALSSDELNNLKSDWGLTDAEAAEINRTEYTPLDAHYLHECMTFRDIARTLSVDNAEANVKVDAALQWVVRHVRLQDRKGLPDAPSQIVFRGSGTPLERLYVFAALVRQLNLWSPLAGDVEAANDPHRLFSCLNIYDRFPRIADSRVGLVLPVVWPDIPCAMGSDHSPDHLKKWNDAGYDITFEQLEKAKAFPSFSYSALSPRMKALEGFLSSLGIHLSVPDLKHDGLQKWPATTLGTPLRVLAEMLSPEEGGNDTSPAGERRMDRYRAQLVPWGSLPQELLKVPGPLGVRVQQIFGDAATLTYQPGLADLLKEKQQRDELTQSMIRELSNAKQRDEMRKSSEQTFRPTVREDAGPSLRQLIQSGRYEDATFGLVSLNDWMRTERKRPEGATSAAAAIEWAGKVPAVYAEFLRAQRGKDPQVLMQAEQAMNELAKSGQSAVKYALWLGSGISLAEANYLIALCKHDQAEARWRREPTSEETKSAARTAAQSWGTFVASFPDSVTVPQAMRLQARALELAGQGIEAAESYRKAAAKLNGLEKTACLILADELKPR